MNEALPSVVVYTIKRFDMFVAKRFMTTKFISLVNLLAGEEVMPEYLTDRDVSEEMAGHALRWLGDPIERAKASNRLADLREKVAKPGATARAADRVLEVVRGAATYRGPHARDAGQRVDRVGSYVGGAASG